MLRIITLPAGAVAKYCDDCVCLCVCESACLSVCPTGYLRNPKRDLYQIFYACCLCPWLGPLPWYVNDRPHRLSTRRGWRECTARAKCNLRLPCWKEHFIEPACVLYLITVQQFPDNALLILCHSCALGDIYFSVTVFLHTKKRCLIL